MGRGVRSIIAAAAFLAAAGAAGCVYPLGVALETWSWGGSWDRAPEEIRGAGEVVSESRTVRGFGAVSVAGPLRVVLERNARERVTITAQENLLPFVETGVHRGVLHVGPVPGASEAWIWAKDRLEVEAAGTSLVRYRGDPVVDARVTAASRVTRY